MPLSVILLITVDSAAVEVVGQPPCAFCIFPFPFISSDLTHSCLSDPTSLAGALPLSMSLLPSSPFSAIPRLKRVEADAGAKAKQMKPGSSRSLRIATIVCNDIKGGSALAGQSSSK
jgi:hypothetical protein